MKYDIAGNQTKGTTTYNYNTNKQLTSIVSPPSNTVKRRFVYDTKGRVTSMIDSIPGTSKFITGFSYDIKGRLSTITHPSGIIETKNYNSFGYLSSVNAGGADRWTTTGMNARQQVTTGKYGSNLNTTLGYDNYGYLTSKVTGTIEDYSYNFDPVSGNLNWRQNNKGSNLKENFYYDNLDRLDNVYMGTTMTLDMAYDGSKGTMTTKTDVGTMLYNTSGKPYRLSNINPATSLTPGNTQSMTYTSFEKVSTISENNYNASFTYNSDDQRVKMDVLQGSSLVVTRWYPTGSFMKDSVSGSSKLYTYIGGDAYTAPCVAVRQGTITRYYYLIRDHLGSIIEISDSTNTKLYEYSYDAWGRMRNPATWVNYSPGSEPALFTGRGFTGHEHLPWFNLINMNGRVYDPLIGQFPSPDNQVQNPGYTQNYNRYGYCFNNPLKYRDITGYGIGDLMRENYYDPLGKGQDQSNMEGNNKSFIQSPMRVFINGIDFTRNADGSTTLNSKLGMSFYPNNDYYSYFLGMQPNGQNSNNRYNTYKLVGKWTPSGRMLPGIYGPIPEMLYYVGNVELGYISDISNYDPALGGSNNDNVYRTGTNLFNYFQIAFTNMENVGPKGGFFIKGYTSVYQSNGRYYLKTSASGKCPGAEVMGNKVIFSGSTSLIVNGNVEQTQNFALPSEVIFSDAYYLFLGVTNMQLPTSGSVELRINASYIIEDDAGGRAVPLPSLTRTLTLH